MSPVWPWMKEFREESREECEILVICRQLAGNEEKDVFVFFTHKVRNITTNKGNKSQGGQGGK